MNLSSPSWHHPSFGSLLLDGLPTGELTFMDYGDSIDGWRGDWPLTVSSLVTANIRASRPVMYVQTGEIGNAGGRALLKELASPLLAVVEDDDVVVYAPPGSCNHHVTADRCLCCVDLHGRGYYSCRVPTLWRVRLALDCHEDRFGPTLLVFDDVGAARPYDSLAPDPERLQGPPGGAELEPRFLTAWLASDMAALAESRPEAPTVVAVGDPTLLTPGDDLRAVSRLVLTSHANDDNATVTMTVERRLSLTEPWQSARTVKKRSW